MSLTEQFIAMVIRLFKKDGFHHQYEGLVHACIGIASEVDELRSAIINDDKENLIEELGDITFYYEAAITQFLCLSEYKRSDVDNAYNNFISIEDDIGEASYIVDLVNKIGLNSCMSLDEVKRGWIYGKNINHKPLLENLVKIIKFVDYIATANNISKQEILEHNMHKLEHVDTGRYRGKKYSDDAAIDRHDKQGKE